jgi:hypothetical protein
MRRERLDDGPLIVLYVQHVNNAFPGIEDAYASLILGYYLISVILRCGIKNGQQQDEYDQQAYLEYLIDHDFSFKTLSPGFTKPCG